MNVSHYQNAAYDRGLAELSGRLATQPSPRMHKIKSLEQQAVSKATVVAPVYQSSQTYLQAQRVKGLQVAKLGSMVNYKFTHIQS